MFNPFRRRHAADEDRAHRAEIPTCLHTALVARYDSIADMGHEDRATGFTCEACSSTFTPAEARALRETEADRIPS